MTAKDVLTRYPGEWVRWGAPVTVVDAFRRGREVFLVTRFPDGGTRHITEQNFTRFYHPAQ